MPTTPPHLATPELTYLEPDGIPDYFRVVSRGFHDEYHDDGEELDRAVTEPDRFFGFQVDGRWVSTCGAFTRSLTVPGGAAVPSAAVTVVTVNPSYRRKGLLTRMMRHQLEDVARRKEPLAILWASEAVIYGRFGYGSAAPRHRITGATRSLDYLPGVDLGDGSVVEVTGEEYLEAAKDVHARLLADRNGALDRPDGWWAWETFDPEWSRGGASQKRFVLHVDASGTPDGYAVFRVKGDWGSTGPNDELRVEDWDAATPTAYAALFRYLLDVDLVRNVLMRNASAEERLHQIVANPRVLHTEVFDGLFVRVVDVKAALEARTWSADLDVVVELEDSLLERNTGRWRIQVAGGTATVSKARRKPDVSMPIRELGATYLGGVSVGELHAAGRVTEHTDGAVAALSTSLSWHHRPFCPDGF